MYSHITAAGAQNIYANQIKKVLITVNTGFTGTITLSDETGTSGSPVIGVITNPAVGQQFVYWVLTNGLCVNPSGTCDLTVNLDLSRQGTAQ